MGVWGRGGEEEEEEGLEVTFFPTGKRGGKGRRRRGGGGGEKPTCLLFFLGRMWCGCEFFFLFLGGTQVSEWDGGRRKRLLLFRSCSPLGYKREREKNHYSFSFLHYWKEERRFFDRLRRRRSLWTMAWNFLSPFWELAMCAASNMLIGGKRRRRGFGKKVLWGQATNPPLFSRL